LKFPAFPIVTDQPVIAPVNVVFLLGLMFTCEKGASSAKMLPELFVRLTVLFGGVWVGSP